MREALFTFGGFKFDCLSVWNAKVVIFALGICAGDISRFPTGIDRSKCHKDFEEPEKSAQKLALRFETSTFEDPILDHFLDTFLEHFPPKNSASRHPLAGCCLVYKKYNIFGLIINSIKNIDGESTSS